MSASVTISPIPSNRWVGAPLLFAQVHWSPASWSSPPKVRQSGQKARGNRGQYSRYSLRRLTLGARGEAYLGLRDSLGCFDPCATDRADDRPTLRYAAPCVPPPRGCARVRQNVLASS